MECLQAIDLLLTEQSR